MTSGRPSSAARDARVDLVLLVLAGRVVAVEEEELGAQQPDAVGALLERAGGLLGGSRGWRRPRSPCRRVVTAGSAACGAGALAPRRRAGVAPLARPRRAPPRPGSTSTRAGVAVEHERRAVGDREHAPARARRRPGSRARGRGSPRGRWRRRGRWRSPRTRVAVEPGGLARRQLVGDDDRPPRPPRRPRARRRGGPARAPRRPRRRRRARAGRGRRGRGRPRPTACGGGVPGRRRRPAGLVDRAAGRVEQRGVVEQQRLGVEDRRLGLAGALGDRRAGLADVLPRRGEGGVRAARVPRAGVPAGVVVGRRRAPRAAERARRPDGDARARPGSRAAARRPRVAPRAVGRASSRGRARGRAPAWPRAAPPSSSPKPSAASASSASSAASASVAARRTTRSWPCRTPSVISAVRLRPSTGPRPVVASLTGRRASKRPGGLDEARRRAGRAGRAGW